MIFLLILMAVLAVGTLNFSYGVALSIAVRLLLPSFVRPLGLPFSLNFCINWGLLGIWLVGYLIRSKSIVKAHIPKIVGITLAYISTLIIYPFIDFEVPFIEQLLTIFKSLSTDYISLFLIAIVAKDIKKVKFVRKTIYSVIFLACVYGIITYIIKINPYIILMNHLSGNEVDYSNIIDEVRGALEGRVQSTFMHPIAWGQIVNVFFLYLLTFKKNNTLWGKVLLVLSAVNVVLSGCRSLWLSILLGGGLYVLCMKTKERIRFLIVSVILLLFAIPCIDSSKEENLYVQTLESSIYFWDQDKSDELGIRGSSVSGRTSQFEGAINLVGDNWLTGLGLSWPDKYQKEHGPHPVLLGFESVFFQIYVEGGLIGFLCWLIFYWTLFLYAWKKLKFTSYSNRLIIYFMPYFVSLLMTASFESFYMFLILLYIGLINIESNQKHGEYKCYNPSLQ